MNFLLCLALLSCVIGVFSDCDIGFCKLNETCCPAEDPEGWRCCPFIEARCLVKNRGRGSNQFEEEDVSSHDLENRVGAFEETESNIAEEAESDVDVTRRCDSSSYCPDENTCCEVLHGGYGCCSIPNAVCCPDKIHCCHAGEQCDASSHYCIRKSPITRAPAEVIEGNDTS
ncbi:granulin [Trichonephila clavata]|uniref:Granulin n=1 Tax=Trichonephila clavata TaxID=2740835 RepID=A0A8X6G0K9_TRICU|nr:granulin [Trichonephila clavata]